MTITGPKLVRPTCGCVIFWISLTGPLRSAWRATTSSLTERVRSIFLPDTDFVIHGLLLRSFSTESTAARSNRLASFATYARVRPWRTAISSGTSLSGAASSARLTAALICGTAPIPAGEERKLRLPTLTTIGWFAALRIATFASAPLIPPTATPPTRTPGAIVVGGTGPVVVVPVVVVVVLVVVVAVVSVDVLVVPVPVAATTDAERPPAARKPRANTTGRARRRTCGV